MNILNVPDDLKQRLRDGVVEFVAHQAEKVPGGDRTAGVIRQLSSQAVFYNAFDKAIQSAIKRFSVEYMTEDEDLVEAIITDGAFWQSKDVRKALTTMVSRPNSLIAEERAMVIQHFMDVLPKRVNRARVDKAVWFFLKCVLDELWTLPGVSEIREIYSLQFQKIEAESARKQVELMEAQLQAMNQLSTDVRQALLQLATALEQKVLSAPPLYAALSNIYPYHNLFQPDYTHFIGRQRELEWLRRRLSTGDRAWQIVIAGIGGVGKSALALSIAHEYREQYQELPVEERFDAIIWFTAKEEVLTIKGREISILPGLIFHTLEDIYTTIAQTLEREDITRTLLGEQDHLVQKALRAQRTLLIIDNFESVTDQRIRTFLRNLPTPTKCIITSREWVDVADVLKLTGLPPEEAYNLIAEEASARTLHLSEPDHQQLFQRTSGLPLPIKLSMARIASGETFEQVMRWLGNAAGDLPEYCIKEQVTLVHVHDLNAWKLLLVCSLFDQESGATREALGVIANLSLIDRDDGLTMLQRLSLLNCSESGRFWMLPLVQNYVRSELAKADVFEELSNRWLGWLLEFSQRYATGLEFHVENTRIIYSEYPNLLAAIRWCHEQQRWQVLTQLTKGIWYYPYLVGLFTELREMLEASIQACQALKDERQEGKFMRRMGRPLAVQGQYEEALDYLQKAEKIARRYTDDAELGQIGNIRLYILPKLGRLSEAEQVAETMLEIGERLNDQRVIFWAAEGLCEIESLRRRFDKAMEWLDRREKWCREYGWLRGLAWMLYRRGIVLVQQGNTPHAEPFFEESLRMANTWNERRLIAFNQYGLAQVYAETNRLQLANQVAEEAHSLCERLGMVIELAKVEKLQQAVRRRLELVADKDQAQW